jgi:hypothetical protein
MPPQVEPVNTGAVAAEVGKLPVGKLENGEAAAVRDIKLFTKLVFSGQIGSAWEWYHCIGLEKDINRYMFLIF